MTTECRRCSKKAILEAAVVRDDEYEVWLPLCQGHLAELIVQEKLRVRRIGQKK